MFGRRKAITLLKSGKAGDTDRVVKSGGDATLDQMWKVSMEAWKSVQKPDDWTKTGTVPMYKEKKT